MKKRVAALFMAIVLCVSLMGCGAGAKDTSKVSVDGNLLTVEITVPASYFEDDDGNPITQEELDENIKDRDGILSATVNEDGSVTYKMTKAAQKEMLSEMKSSIDESIQELIDGGNVSFTKVTYNDDMTEFAVETPETSLGLMDTMYVLVFYMYGVYYNAFAGNEVEDIVVHFVNSDTGEEIQTSHYADLVESEAE